MTETILKSVLQHHYTLWRCTTHPHGGDKDMNYARNPTHWCIGRWFKSILHCVLKQKEKPEFIHFYMRHISSLIIKHQGRKVSWFLLSDKIFQFLWIVVYQSSKGHTREAKLSQALCVPVRDWLNYSPNEGTGEDNVRYYAVPLSSCTPKHTGFFRLCLPPPQVLQTWLSA